MSINLLGRHGDPLEREIVRTAADALVTVIEPYSTVWATHVFQRRLPDAGYSRVPAEWMDFAGSHYTALIRLYHAFKALSSLKRACEVELTADIGARLLEIHELTASYWWNIGAAIDTLGSAFSDAPCTKLKKGSGSKWLKINFPDLATSYDRRTQFIHSRIVPISVDGGMPVFCFQQLKSDENDGGDQPKYTPWDVQFAGRHELVGDFYDTHWPKFLSAARDAWFHLQRWLRDTDNDIPATRGGLAVEVGLADNPSIPSNIQFQPPGTGYGSGGFAPNSPPSG